MTQSAFGDVVKEACAGPTRRQQREFGIRLALGANSANLMRAVMGLGLKLTTAGLLFGVLGSILLGRALQALLFEVDATDPATFLAVKA